MSDLTTFDLMAAARRYRAGGPGPKATLMVLVEHMGLDGEMWSCWPSVAALADQTEQSARTVQRHLRQFTKDGLIATQERSRENGSQSSNTYVLVPEVLVGGVTPCHPTGGVTMSPLGVTPMSPPELPDELPEEPSRGADATDALPKFATYTHTGFPTVEAVRLRRAQYPQPFEDCWLVYPKRGGHSKLDAYKAWLVRVSDAKVQGVDQDKRVAGLRVATERFATAMRWEERDPTHIMHAARFYGPSDVWREYYRWVEPRGE